jgi:fermentation-respiration switch protein FrsA (DUF1100 family)
MNRWNFKLASAVCLFVSIIALIAARAAAVTPQTSKNEIATRHVNFYSEGVKLAGDLFIPEGLAAGEKRAGIVLCYGYTGNRSLYEPPTAQALSQAGYVVLTFDYKGWGDSEGPRTRLAPYGRVIDTQAALTFLSVQPQVDANQVGLYGSSYGGATVIFTAAIDPRVKTVMSVTGPGIGLRWMRSIRHPDEYADMLDRAAADRALRVTTGKSEMVDRNEILIPDRLSLKIATDTRQKNGSTVSKIPLEYIDDTAGFNPEWVVDKISPRPVLFLTTDNDRLVPGEVQSVFAHAAEPKKLIVLKGFGHYELYSGEGFRQLTAATLAWFTEQLPARPSQN